MHAASAHSKRLQQHFTRRLLCNGRLPYAGTEHAERHCERGDARVSSVTEAALRAGDWACKDCAGPGGQLALFARAHDLEAAHRHVICSGGHGGIRVLCSKEKGQKGRCPISQPCQALGLAIGAAARRQRQGGSQRNNESAQPLRRAWLTCECQHACQAVCTAAPAWVHLGCPAPAAEPYKRRQPPDCGCFACNDEALW